MADINVEIKKLPNSEIEITGTISVEDFTKERAEAIKHIGNSITVDGFRKGNIPEKVIVSKVGEQAILEEMAELALAKAYPHIVHSHKLNVIGRPKIQINKLAANNPLEFRIISAVVPEVTLPDYQKIAAKEMSATKNESEDAHEISDKELTETIDRIRSSRKGTEENAVLPELNDTFVQSLGDFSDVEDFKHKIKEGLHMEKHQKAREKKRVALAEALIAGSQIELPQIIIDNELDRIEAQFNEDLSRMGIRTEDYLKHLKKTPEQMREEWIADAKKKATFQIILNTIANKEKITAPEDEVAKEVAHILDHYKDADPERVRVYAASLLTNEKVFEFLELQK